MDVKNTYKSKDTEERFDTIFNRPIGYLWAKFFNFFGIHPNVVTVLSMILGAISGWLFHYHANSQPALWGMTGMTCNILAVILLVWANHYDSADGQLARMSGKKTQLGRILDGTAADVWYVSIYFCLAYRIYDDPIPFTNGEWIFGWGGLALAAISGIFGHIPECRLADYYRNIHLYFVNGKEGSEFDHYENVCHQYENTSWKDNKIQKVFLWFYRNYTHMQEKQTPHFQAYWQMLKDKYGDDIPKNVRQEFRKKSFPLLKYTNFLTFNVRGITLYIAALMDMAWLYLVFEIVVFTIVYKYMHYRHEKMCRELLQLHGHS